MGGRTFSALTVLLAAGVTACREPALELRPGSTVPAEWIVPARGDGTDVPGNGTALVWVFRTDDCLTCQSFDYAVRRLQATYRDSVPFVAVHVGSASREEVPRSFFRARRIDVARRVTISPREFGRTYGDTGLPALLVVRGNTVVWSSTLPSGVATAAQMDSLLQSVRTEGLGARN